MKKNRWLTGMLFLCMMLLAGCSGESYGTPSGEEDTEIKKESAELFAMDTIIDITVYDKEPSKLLEEARELVETYENMFSVNSPDSDVAKLNSAQGKPIAVSPETYELIQKSIEISKRTEGLFDISIYPLVRAWGFTTESYRVPDEKERAKICKVIDSGKIQLLENETVCLPEGMQIDLGGIAKGYVSQKLVEHFRDKGAAAAVISLGGNVQTYGKKPDGTLFTVGITNPQDGSSVLGTIEVGEKAVITSGSYQRYFEKDGVTYHHIMDKRTGAPAESDLTSVTILSDNGESADSLATALFVMGKEKAIAFDEKNEDVQCILIDKENQVWTSEGVNFTEMKE